jgi:hypothetical protein
LRQRRGYLTLDRVLSVLISVTLATLAMVIVASAIAPTLADICRALQRVAALTH